MISLCLPYYENPAILRVHLDYWEAYPDEAKSGFRVVIVDDGSPLSPAHKMIRDVGVDIEVYRIKKDVPWGQDQARNLAMHVLKTEWALLTDMDHILPGDQAVHMLRTVPHEPGTVIRPNQVLANGHDLRRPHPNTWLVHKRDFWACGGYDEDFVGWYGSDGNFRKNLLAHAREQIVHRPTLVVYRTEDCFDANTKAYGRKESEYYVSRNKALMAKIRGPAYVAQRPIRFEWERVL